MGKLQVDILGTSFCFESSSDQEYLEKLLDYYKEIIHYISENSGTSNPLNISIMAGLTLLDELFKNKKETQGIKVELQKNDVDKAEKVALDMINILNSALSND